MLTLRHFSKVPSGRVILAYVIGMCVYAIIGVSQASANVPSVSVQNCLDILKLNFSEDVRPSAQDDNLELHCERAIRKSAPSERMPIFDLLFSNYSMVLSADFFQNLDVDWSAEEEHRINGLDLVEKTKQRLFSFEGQDPVSEYLSASEAIGDDLAIVWIGTEASVRLLNAFNRKKTDDFLHTNKGEDFIQLTLEATRRMEDLQLESQTLHYYGTYHKSVGAIGDALTSLQEGLRISKLAPQSQKTMVDQLAIYIKLGNIFSDLNNPKRSVEFYKQGIDIAERLSSSRKANAYSAQVRTNLGIALRMDNRPAESVVFLKAAQLVINQMSDEDPVKLVRLSFIDHELARARYEAGLASIDEVHATLASLFEYRSADIAASAASWVALEHLNQNDDQRARQALNMIEEFAPDMTKVGYLKQYSGDSWFSFQYAKAQGLLYERLGNPGLGFQYKSLALELSEKRFAERDLEAASNTALLLEYEKREERISRLSTEARLSEEKAALALERAELSEDRSILARRAALTLAILFVAAGLIAVNLYRTRKALKEVALAKTVFLREMHHRIGNNFQALAALVGAAQQKTELESSLEARADGATRRLGTILARVQTMASAHAQLHVESNGTSSNFADYLRNLTSLIKDSFGDDRITVSVSAEAIDVPVSMIVPSGLIVTELVSNAYEHAFPDRETGEIKVEAKTDGLNLKLQVSDNGVGLSEDDHTKSLGLSVVNDLAYQLDGSAACYSVRNGTDWLVSVPIR